MIEQVSLIVLMRIFHRHHIEVKIVPEHRFMPIQMVRLVGMLNNKETDQEILYSLDGQLIYQNTSKDWDELLTNIREEASIQREQGLV